MKRTHRLDGELGELLVRFLRAGGAAGLSESPAETYDQAAVMLEAPVSPEDRAFAIAVINAASRLDPQFRAVLLSVDERLRETGSRPTAPSPMLH